MSGSLTEFGYTLEPDYPLLFVNAGGEALLENANPGIEIQPDIFFQGGDVLRTDETIAEGGDIPSVYQSAWFGNFSYRFENLSPGEYYVDLHFAEIIYTNGPQGMRSFDVFMQEEKASDLTKGFCHHMFFLYGTFDIFDYGDSLSYVIPLD